MALRLGNGIGLAACIIVSAAAGIPRPAAAMPTVATDSAIFVERIRPGNARQLEPADELSSGDRVVTLVTWERATGNGGFVITNPLPRAIAYQASAREDEDVSVDGGRTWGKLGTLRVGQRPATARDVTHVRWRIPAFTAARGRGQIAYAGIVR